MALEILVDATAVVATLMSLLLTAPVAPGRKKGESNMCPLSAHLIVESPFHVLDTE